jgi:phage terminase large subunit-like protein
MAEGVCDKTDPAGNMKPDKANSQRKIDGIVTLLMCLDRQMRNMSGEGGKSVYDGGGVKFI